MGAESKDPEDISITMPRQGVLLRGCPRNRILLTVLVADEFLARMHVQTVTISLKLFRDGGHAFLGAVNEMEMAGISSIPKTQSDGFAPLADTPYFENVDCCRWVMNQTSCRSNSALLQPQLSTILSVPGRLA